MFLLFIFADLIVTFDDKDLTAPVKFYAIGFDITQTSLYHYSQNS